MTLRHRLEVVALAVLAFIVCALVTVGYIDHREHQDDHQKIAHVCWALETQTNGKIGCK